MLHWTLPKWPTLRDGLIVFSLLLAAATLITVLVRSSTGPLIISQCPALPACPSCPECPAPQATGGDAAFGDLGPDCLQLCRAGVKAQLRVLEKR